MCSITDMNSWTVFSNSPKCGTQTFTLLFTESIMTVLPTCLALIVGVLRLLQLRKRSYKARRERLYGWKMVVPILYFSLYVEFRSILNRRIGLLDATYGITASSVGRHGSAIYSQIASVNSRSSDKLCFIFTLYLCIRSRTQVIHQAIGFLGCILICDYCVGYYTSVQSLYH